MMTASNVFIPPPPGSVGRRCGWPDSPFGLPSSKRFRDESIHAREVGADVPLVLHRERGITPESSDQGLEKPLDGRRIDQPDVDAAAELRRKRVGPLRELVELRLEVLREPGVHELPLHFPSKAHDLPGHFAVLSVVVLGGNVGDHFDLNRSVEGPGGRDSPSLLNAHSRVPTTLENTRAYADTICS